MPKLSKFFTFENVILGGICIGVLTFAVLYYKGDITMKKRYNYSRLNKPSLATDACEYLAETVSGYPNENDINNLCYQYQQVCGEGSTASEILELDSNFEGPQDGAYFVNALQQDLLEAKMDVNKCSPLMSCKKAACPSFLKCENGSCI